MDAVIDNASYHGVQEDKCPTQSSRKADISWVHMQNLHPGANLHPGCKFVPRVYFWPCERCFKNLHPECKFAPTFEVEQIYLHPGATLLPGAICAYERKLFNFYTFGSEILIYRRPFLIRSCINRYEK